MKRYQKDLFWIVSGCLLGVALGFSVGRWDYPFLNKTRPNLVYRCTRRRDAF